MKMNLYNRVAYLLFAAVVCAGLTGCFSYHRTVEKTTTPAATAPSSTSQTTTTTSDDGTVERHSTTTYSNP
ncbi:MAG TPA: hypothetical protein VJ718_05830 [Candidatus Binataceae bacterium]|jgi:hypothetical protein|nr:hypothetical protein [Candidatus Binataceae bacterium]